MMGEVIGEEVAAAGFAVVDLVPVGGPMADMGRAAVLWAAAADWVEDEEEEAEAEAEVEDGGKGVVGPFIPFPIPMRNSKFIIGEG